MGTFFGELPSAAGGRKMLKFAGSLRSLESCVTLRRFPPPTKIVELTLTDILMNFESNEMMTEGIEVGSGAQDGPSAVQSEPEFRDSSENRPAIVDPPSGMSPEEMQSFRDALVSANRVVVLCGAGLSTASGLGVFLQSRPQIKLTHNRHSEAPAGGGEITRQRKLQHQKHLPVTHH